MNTRNPRSHVDRHIEDSILLTDVARMDHIRGAYGLPELPPEFVERRRRIVVLALDLDSGDMLPVGDLRVWEQEIRRNMR